MRSCGRAAIGLQAGDRLGPYEIQALLGLGGMGEVYRGRDTRLGRDVALKVISPRRVEDASLRRRFELEARAASGFYLTGSTALDGFTSDTGTRR